MSLKFEDGYLARQKLERDRFSNILKDECEWAAILMEEFPGMTRSEALLNAYDIVKKAG